MKNSFKKIMLSLISVGIAGVAQAQEAPLNSAATNAATDPSWQFVVAPYIWALNMNGNVKIGNLNAPISESFSDILKQLDFAGMLYLGANKDKWGVFLDSLYSVTSDKAYDGPLTAKLINKFGIFTLAGSYRAYEKNFKDSASSIAITPYAGVRYTFNNATVKVNYNSFYDSASSNQHWADPIIGARLDYYFNPQWSSVVFADGGSGNFSRDYTYKIAGLVGYRPITYKTATIYGGYQYLKEKYTTGSGSNAYTWNMKLFGPVVGLAFVF